MIEPLPKTLLGWCNVMLEMMPSVWYRHSKITL